MADPNAFAATLDDPVARRTRWGPASGGGASFRTHRLIEVSPDRLEYRQSLSSKVMSGLFIAIGFAFLVAAVYFTAIGKEKGWMVVLPGLLPGGVGAFFYYLGARPRVFEFNHQRFWKGRKPTSDRDIEDRKDCARFDEIHALQIVRETVRTPRGGSGSNRTSGSTFFSYELNLVLKDGARINVIDHGDLDAIRTDAARLTERLNRPVWDATTSIPVVQCEWSGVGCLLTLLTVFGGFVLFVIGAALLLMFSHELARMGIGSTWILLFLLAILTSVLIVFQVVRRSRKAKRECRSQ